MRTPSKHKRRLKTQFGDFQTPPLLAAQVCQLAKLHFPEPNCIIEPTCGIGRLLSQAQTTFPDATQLIGADINREYIKQCRKTLTGSLRPHQKLQLLHQSFFDIDWEALSAQQQGQILVLGNPPWVTSATLGKISSSNLPEKSKQPHLRGVEAITGKSNFDISEWICLKLLQHLPVGRSNFALLVKTAVARKVLKTMWQHSNPLENPRLMEVDARQAFSASVDACLFMGTISPSPSRRCMVFPGLSLNKTSHSIGYEGKFLIADLEKHARTRQLEAPKPASNWRSGVKHDCAKALELTVQGDCLVNGYDEEVDVEPEFVFPLKKSSDIATGNSNTSRRLLITQRSTGDSPLALQQRAPRLWAYLQKHALSFEARKSSIYRGRPPFSMFGIGAYSFAPYKVAISGLYKHLSFRHQGPVDQKPVLFDDTVYFLPFEQEHESRAAHELLSGDMAQDFLHARIFWDAKRPITATILRSLCLETLQSLSATEPGSAHPAKESRKNPSVFHGPPR